MGLATKIHFMECRPVSLPRKGRVTKMEVDNYQKSILQKRERYVRTHFFHKINLDRVEVGVDSGNGTLDIKRRKRRPALVLSF